MLNLRVYSNWREETKEIRQLRRGVSWHRVYLFSTGDAVDLPSLHCFKHLRGTIRPGLHEKDFVHALTTEKMDLCLLLLRRPSAALLLPLFSFPSFISLPQSWSSALATLRFWCKGRANEHGATKDTSARVAYVLRRRHGHEALHRRLLVGADAPQLKKLASLIEEHISSWLLSRFLKT